MMDQFQRIYWPGGMSWNYSSWRLVEHLRNGWTIEHKILEWIKHAP